MLKILWVGMANAIGWRVGSFGWRVRFTRSSTAEKPYPCQKFSGLAWPMPLVGVYGSQLAWPMPLVGAWVQAVEAKVGVYRSLT